MDIDSLFPDTDVHLDTRNESHQLPALLGTHANVPLGIVAGSSKGPFCQLLSALLRAGNWLLLLHIANTS